MKKQIEVHYTETLVGDEFVSRAGAFITVEREIPSEYKVGQVLSTKEEFKEAPRQTVIVDCDGDVLQKTDDKFWTSADYCMEADDLLSASYGPFTVLHIGGTEVKQPAPVAPAKPQITYADFVNTVISVVDDNNIDVGEAALGRIIMFTADRLGLY